MRLPLLLLARMQTVLLPFALGGCEQPFDRAPPGFVDACYGGIDNWDRNWVCSDQRQIMTLAGTEANWPKLAEVLKNFGKREGLKVFDTGANYPGYIRTLEVYICSADGLHLSADDRVYEHQQFNHDLETIRVVLRTYNDDFDWQPLADRLSQELVKEWHAEVSIDRPEPSGDERALPDSIKTCGSNS